MTIDVDADTHYPVGPFEDVYDHGPVTVVEQVDRDGVVFYICLECGYLDDDVRRFAHEECDRASNPINQTWRERVGGDFPG